MKTMKYHGNIRTNESVCNSACTETSLTQNDISILYDTVPIRLEIQRIKRINKSLRNKNQFLYDKIQQSMKSRSNLVVGGWEEPHASHEPLQQKSIPRAQSLIARRDAYRFSTNANFVLHNDPISVMSHKTSVTRDGPHPPTRSHDHV